MINDIIDSYLFESKIKLNLRDKAVGGPSLYWQREFGERGRLSIFLSAVSHSGSNPFYNKVDVFVGETWRTGDPFMRSTKLSKVLKGEDEYKRSLDNDVKSIYRQDQRYFMKLTQLASQLEKKSNELWYIEFVKYLRKQKYSLDLGTSSKHWRLANL